MEGPDNRTLAMQVPHARSGPRPSLRVTVQGGPDQGIAIAVAKPAAVIGRGETVDVRLTDPTVSQFHVQLEVSPDGIDVTDLGSLNGTWCGAAAIRQARIPFGSELRLGSTRLLLGRDADFEVELSSATSFGELVGASAAMREVYALLDRLSKTSLSLLLEGETGTGKELAARGIHAESARAKGPFVTVDCTAIPPTLAESVLFGHERGAFTGATEPRVGIIEAASGGTLFFDEIGDLGTELQPKLLRVLERREVQPVGSSRSRPIDVRVVSASWRDLRAMVNARTFREDLYFRLAQARVRLPSLAERPEDVKPLIQHVLGKIPWTVQAARAIDKGALEVLAGGRFAGNVRELRSTVERLAMLAGGATITLEDLAFDRMLGNDRAGPPAPSIPPPGPGASPVPIEPFKDAKRTVIDEFEKDYLARLLTRTGMNISRAAALARIERQSLRDLLKKHGLRGDE